MFEDIKIIKIDVLHTMMIFDTKDDRNIIDYKKITAVKLNGFWTEVSFNFDNEMYISVNNQHFILEDYMNKITGIKLKNT